ncbi:recombination regulator RecX [Simiduia sp. 21SJ11W-1]|uniref:regulatory protein RecX n=1 Tax=Simiduia sp. 21SJ11W-1 TaxID=2909669 RepID=UPI00209CF593|nr:regulatory protein RecX [Simiduia sp. 21SJ11W-1]UTA49198.1 recombination regulator RecX [Simiduia sp. 21SJ11W-1]
MAYSRNSKPSLTTEPEVMDACIRLLARRDYSAGELRKKLAAKSADQTIVERVIARVQELGYQNDERYAGAYVRYAISQGKGPGWIAAQLFQREIHKALIDDSIESAEVDWQALAEEQLQRKFKGPALDPKELARQFRYLSSRGFQPDIIRSAVDSLKAEAVL